MFTRIHWRIAASYVALITLVFLSLGVYLVGYLREQHLTRLEAELQRQARLVADNAQYHLATNGAASLDPLAKQLGREVGVRITLIAADGTVLGDSDHDPATMDNHATRPEVREALQTGSGESQRHSPTLEQELLYVAVPMRQGSAVVGVARVALPIREVREALNQVVVVVATALAAAALLAIVLAVVVARFTAQPIQALTRAVQQLADGAPHQIIPAEGRDEVSLLARAFNDMAVRLRAHLQTVEDERGRLASVLSHMTDGLVIVDWDGVVYLINPVAARLLEIAPPQAQGRSVIAVVRDHELAMLVGEVLAGDTAAVPPRLVELGSYGRRHAIQATVSRIPRGDGAGPQVLLVLHDVTELRRAESVRREFVANISHELRTPVSSLKALADTLLDGALEDPEVARDFLERMHVEIDGLAQLVAELLELARIESGQVALRLQPVDLVAVAGAAAERLRPQAERQGLQLTIHRTDKLPSIHADPERIQQVVINLVHNAIKFTPPGGRVRVGVAQRDDAIAVVVADNGVGIAGEVLPRLFERFYKADKARASGGTGLGLAIAKHLVQAHGGQIWAESAGEGQGATFTFTLPRAPASTKS